MITEVHPACVLIAVVGVLAMFYSLMFLLKAGCIDPGFLPRARPDEAACNQALGDEGTRLHLIVPSATRILHCTLCLH